MPRLLHRIPDRLENMCLLAYISSLYDEMHLIYHLKAYKDKSVLLRHFGLEPDTLVDKLEAQLQYQLPGILQNMSRQKMVNILILTLGKIQAPNGNSGYSDSLNMLLPQPHGSKPLDDCTKPLGFQVGVRSLDRPIELQSVAVHQYRSLPIFQLLEFLVHSELKVLDFSINKNWADCDQMQDVARTLWKIIGEKCFRLEKFIVPKELVYSSTMGSVIQAGQYLTHLTLKRNIPNNMFLHLIGKNCPQLKELDIAGADVVTDFGIVCLLFDDPEHMFLESWNREKTVGSVRKSARAFPHPHFDKPIPDPTEPPTAASNSRSTQFLHLKKSFHEVVRDPVYEWTRLPICLSLRKLRLENTKVKGDGASVVLECCPNVYSLGYLVFAAAGLKQVYGYDDPYETKFTEIFYRGPSDQKLQTIANCCPRLNTMFLGSNSVRRLNPSVFTKWPNLQYLTLENIVVEDVTMCLALAGPNLKGLKIQCSGFDLIDVAINCPLLESFVIQKETPLSTLSTNKMARNVTCFQVLKDLEITCQTFPKICLGFILRHSVVLRSLKVFHIPGLRRSDFDDWHQSLRLLEALVIYRAPELNREDVEHILSLLPNLDVFGDIHSLDFRRPADVKRLQNRIRDEGWDLRLIDSTTPGTIVIDEKEFNKLLSLHWFYLTRCPKNKIYRHEDALQQY